MSRQAASNRSINATTGPAGINHVVNPSFEIDTSNWSGTGSGSTLTRVTTDSYVNLACGRMDTNANDQWVSVVISTCKPSTAYTFSVFVKGTVGETIHLNIWTGAADVAGSALTLTGGWQRLSTTQTVASSGSPELQVRRSAGDSTNSVYIDAAMIEEGTTLNNYFDGSFIGCVWLSAANASRSQRYGRSVTSALRTGDLGITHAVHLTGASGVQVTVGQSTFLNSKTAFTFGARIFPTSSSMSDLSNWWAYGFSSANNKGYCMRPVGSGSRKLQFFYGSGSSNSNSLNIVGKQYIFIEYDGITLHFYDGTTLKDSFTVSAQRDSDAAVQTYYGCRDPGNRQFTGVLGDGAIYSRVLTATEKAAIVQRANYPTGSLELLYKLDEGSGTSITDFSGNSRTGTLSSSAIWRNSPFIA